ncbi:hypothetical protein ANN_26655 [Periplaneta americana]|uniref:DDE-1 domain-containing protein n=1 Tax=Periplaneta americana TaxID=6978 RepID=A0ABQ8RYU7_PERAM|nr:hypothetical protein ANN_26655 [Periplaneta americana]
MVCERKEEKMIAHFAEEDMRAAVELVINQGMSLRQLRLEMLIMPLYQRKYCWLPFPAGALFCISRMHHEEKAKDTYKKSLQDNISTSEWKDNVTSVPDWLRRETVAKLRLATGHDCLGKHLCRTGLLQNPNCPLCNQNIVMDSDHLMDCPPLHWYVKKRKKNENGDIRMYLNYDCRRIFTDEQEASLESYLLICAKMCYGLDIIEACRLAFQMVQHNNVEVPENCFETKQQAKSGCTILENDIHKLNRLFLKGAPPGILGLATPSGWMNGKLFSDVIRHFVKYIQSSKENPTLLTLDNHESHLAIEALDIAKENCVIMLTIPPHCSNHIQPLDVSVFKSFQALTMLQWISGCCTIQVFLFVTDSTLEKDDIPPPIGSVFVAEEHAYQGTETTQGTSSQTAEITASRVTSPTMPLPTFVGPENFRGFPKAENRKGTKEGKIEKGKDADGDYEVTFLRKGLKNTNDFLFPQEPDIASVPECDIVMILPQLTYLAKTKRRNACMTFEVNLISSNFQKLVNNEVDRNNSEMEGLSEDDDVEADPDFIIENEREEEEGEEDGDASSESCKADSVDRSSTGRTFWKKTMDFCPLPPALDHQDQLVNALNLPPPPQGLLFTNMRYHTVTGKALKCTIGEMKKFISATIMMYLGYPRIRMYWTEKTKVKAIADKITRDSRDTISRLAEGEQVRHWLGAANGVACASASWGMCFGVERRGETVTAEERESNAPATRRRNPENSRGAIF